MQRKLSTIHCVPCVEPSFPFQYVGSFLVPESSGDQSFGVLEECKNDYVSRQLVSLRGISSTKSVLLVVSVGGIKMCSLDGKTVHMAHALKRIHYATCDPENRQFAFLAREPRKNNNNGLQFCHVFNTETTEEAEEINSIVGNAFRAAYLCQIKREAEEVIKQKEYSPDTSSDFNPSSGDLKKLTNGCDFRKTEIELPLTPKEIKYRDLEESDQGAKFRSETSSQRILRNRLAEDCEPKYESVPIELPLAMSTAERRSVSPNRPETSCSASLSTATNDTSAMESLTSSADENLASSSNSDSSAVSNGNKRSVPLSPNNDEVGNGETTPYAPAPGTDARLRRKLRDFKTPPRPTPVDESRKVRLRGMTSLRNMPISELRSQSPIYGNEDAILTNKNRGLPTIPSSRPPRTRPMSMIVPGVSSIGENKEWPNETPIGEISLPMRKQAGGSVRGSLMKKLFRRSKTPSSADLSGRSMLDGGTDGLPTNASGLDNSSVSVGFVSMRSSQERRRRPMSEMFTDAIRNIGSSFHSVNGGVRGVSPPYPLRKEGSPRLSCKSLNVPASRSAQRSNMGSDMGAMDRKMRRSANLEQLFRVRESTGRSLNGGIERRKVKESPGGTGCGDACQFMGTSPEMPHKSSEILLPVDTQDEMRLQNQVWFHADSTRETVVRVLKISPEGSFVVRRSATQRCCLAISVRVGVHHNFQKVSHYLILKTSRGFKLKGMAKVFPSVQSLVTHHSIMPEQLPCRLKFVNWDEEAFKNDDKHDRNSNSSNGEERIYGSVSVVTTVHKNGY